MRRLLRRVWFVLRRRRLEADLADEMAAHRDMARDDLLRRGLPPLEAQRDARRQFGSAALAQNRSRDVWIPPALQDLTGDVRLAVRLVANDRAFATAAVLTLALGIGTAGTLFTIFDGMFLKGLPVDRPDRIVTVAAVDAQGRPLQLSSPQFDEWRMATTHFTGLAAYAGAIAIFEDEGQASERLAASYVSASAFTVLGDRPLLGRTFSSDEDRPGTAPVVVIGESVWRERYGRDPQVIGRVVTINGKPTTVVGVMPARFRFPMIDDAWLPLGLRPQAQERKRDARTLQVVGRLTDGATLAQARTELDAIAARLARDYPDTDAGMRAAVKPYIQGFTGFNNPWSDALLGASFLLLIACANVACLLLVRAAGRGRDLAIRTALGATRWRMLRQLLVESLLLSTLAGGLGLGLTWAGMRLWIALLPVTNWPYWFRWDIDARVLVFLVIASAMTAILAGLAPAIHLSRGRTSLTLKQDVRIGGPGSRARRWTGALLAAELALTIVLLAGAGLMIRTTINLLHIDSIVDVPHVLMANVNLTSATYATPEERVQFVDTLADRLDATPGIRSSTVANAMPLYTAPLRELRIIGRAAPSNSPGPIVSYVAIGRHYFATLGTHVFAGRDFVSMDGAPGHLSAIVNQRFVQMFFGGENPIGTSLELADPNAAYRDEAPLTIVGVSPTIRQHYAQDLDPVVYVPYRQDPTPVPVVFARTTEDPNRATPALRQVVREIDSHLVVFNVMPLEQLTTVSGFANQVFLTFFGVFAVFALLLSAMGLYAATRHTVTERRHEIGVRMTLGARPNQVVWLLTRRALLVLGIGSAAGLAGAVVVGRLMRGFLVATSPSDATTLISITSLLALVSLIATIVPARRALRVDPAITLRCE